MNITHEEEYLGFSIYIEPNPDQYNEGFIWSVSDETNELDTGLEFTLNQALEAAKQKALELKPN
ncbi:MAG: hypothetical protein ACI88H_000658 [Cocleimonas sp.]|jgi:hypothetical protein